MALLRQAMGLPPDDFRTDDRLKEISFGAWEGLTWPEVAAADAQRHAERNRDRWAFVPPDGESYAQVADRLEPWLEAIPDDAVVVAHGGVARALLVMLTGLDPKIAPRVDIWQGRLLAFEAGGCHLDMTPLEPAAQRLAGRRPIASHAVFTCGGLWPDGPPCYPEQNRIASRQAGVCIERIGKRVAGCRSGAPVYAVGNIDIGQQRIEQAGATALRGLKNVGARYHGFNQYRCLASDRCRRDRA